MRPFPTWILLLICFVILCAGLIPYFIRFNNGLAIEQGTFGTFGDYLNPFLSLISISLLGYISFRANQITQTFNQIQLQPHLYLGMENSSIVPGDEDWVIRNGYEAPAINILVRMTFNRKTNTYTKWVNCFSLAKDEKKELAWIRWPDEIQVIWSDMARGRFFRIVYRDWTGELDSNFTSTEYSAALNEARSHTLNTNYLLTRDFKNHFFGTPPAKLTQQSYEQYLRQRGVI